MNNMFKIRKRYVYLSVYQIPTSATCSIKALVGLTWNCFVKLPAVTETCKSKLFE